MKVASLALLALSLLAHRVDSQFVCNFCAGVGIQNPDGVVNSATTDPDRTCTELEADANAFNITEGECPNITSVAAPVCCVATAAPTTPPPPTVSPTESPSTAEPTGTPTAAPTESPSTAAPSGTPTAAPTGTPTAAPTGTPTAAPTGAPTLPPAPECYSNLDDIFAREQAVVDSTVYREFILCPDTDFFIGMLSASGFTGGSAPLYPRRNTSYKCGKDGKSSNNCKVVGGQFQLVAFDVFGPWDPSSQYADKTNITIAGITFEAGFFGSVLLGDPGDITFADCIFQKQKTIASILSVYGNPTRRRLGEKIEQHSLISTLLSGGYYNQWENEHKRRIEVQQELDRDLQEKTLDVIITNCVFEENIIAEVLNPLTQSTIILMQLAESRLEIYDSIFRGNMYNKPEVQLSGSAIETAGPLKIENTCFLDNRFLKYAPVILYGSQASLTASGNYGNVIGDEDLACDFAILFQSRADFEDMDFKEMNKFACVDFNATECAETATPEPTTTPSMAPSRRSRFAPTTPEPTILLGTPAPVGVTGAPTPTAGAARRAIISLSAAASALTAFFIF